MHFDLQFVIDFYGFGCELNSDGHVVLVGKFALDVLVEDGGFADACFGREVPWCPMTMTLNTILSIIMAVVRIISIFVIHHYLFIPNHSCCCSIKFRTYRRLAMPLWISCSFKVSLPNLLIDLRCFIFAFISSMSLKS